MACSNAFQGGYILYRKKDAAQSQAKLRQFFSGMNMNAIDTRHLDVVDSYPLSSLQQGILFHCLDAVEQGVYVSQIVCTLDEGIDTSALVRAWQRVVERHAIFRTSFRWDGNQEPIQEIHRQVEVPFEVEDWRHLTSSHQEQRRLKLLAHDRRRGFNLSRAPITRLKLIRCAEHQYKLLWTYHHILLDGRSTFVIMDEVFQYYQAFRDSDDLELAKPRPLSRLHRLAARPRFRAI